MLNFVTRILCSLVLSFVLISFTGINTASARDDSEPKFTNSEADKFVGERFVDGCMKQYMGMYRTDNLPIEQQQGFEGHARSACECLLVHAKLQFTPREIATASRLCCENFDTLTTDEMDVYDLAMFHRRYIKFFMDSDMSRSCGLQVHEDSDKRLYKSDEAFEKAMRKYKTR